MATLASHLSQSQFTSHPTSHPTWNQPQSGPILGSTLDSTHGRFANTYQTSIATGTGLARPKVPARRPQPLRSMTSAPSGYVSRHGKLHKRSDSGSSLISSASTMAYANKTDAAFKTTASQRIKPYLRKMSMKDDDEEQGRLDLSRPWVGHEAQDEDGPLSGLAIRDFSAPSRSVSEVTFISAGRRTSHKRAASVSSPTSSHFTQRRSSQSVVPPMRTPSNPYTPTSAFSGTFPHSEDEVDESADILADDLHRTSIERWRSRRTTSIGSAPYNMNPSQNYSAASLTKLANVSQSNLSTRSGSSIGTAPEIKIGPLRRDTARSIDLGTTASSRNSIDRAVSFLSRTSEPEDPSSRAANIRALRRAFEEKEAAKERKLEKAEMKRRDTFETKRQKQEEQQRRKSEVSDRLRNRRSANSTPDDNDMNEKVIGTEYSRHAPKHDLGLPITGGENGVEDSETRVKTEVSKTKAAKGVVVRFRAWVRTRLLNCY